MKTMLLKQTKAGLLWRTAITSRMNLLTTSTWENCFSLEKKRSKEAYLFLIPRSISSKDMGKSLPQSPCDSELCQPKAPGSAFDRCGLCVAPSGIMQPAFCLALNTVFWVGVPLLLICKPWWCAADAYLPFESLQGWWSSLLNAQPAPTCMKWISSVCSQLIEITCMSALLAPTFAKILLIRCSSFGCFHLKGPPSYHRAELLLEEANAALLKSENLTYWSYS